MAAQPRYDVTVIEYETQNWLGTVLRVRGTVLPRVVGRTVAVGLLTAGILALREHSSLVLAIPGTAHAMVGVALGLLLVFRTNASYARFWEGRVLIGGIASNCQDLARQCAAYLPHLDSMQRRELAGDITAFAAVMAAHLRSEAICEGVPELTEDRAALLQEVRSPPLHVVGWLGRRFTTEADAGRLPEQRLQTLERSLSNLVDLWGGCERIVHTPVPFAYAHHIKSFLTIFCFTAPFTMVGIMGWYAPFAAAIVAFGLYGIDEIGVEIEDPFGRDANDLPIEAIVESVAHNVREALQGR